MLNINQYINRNNFKQPNKCINICSPSTRELPINKNGNDRYNLLQKSCGYESYQTRASRKS